MVKEEAAKPVSINLPEGITEAQFKSFVANLTKQAQSQPEGGEVVFTEFESGNDKIKVYRDVYKGRELLSVRKFWQDNAGAWQPGKGVTLTYEDIDLITEGLTKMKEWCEEHPRSEKEV